MQARALLYHDVVEENDFAASGFPGAGANRYKLDAHVFRAHIDAVAQTRPRAASVLQLLNSRETTARPALLLTFDDGGASAYTHIASALQELGWRGHFLVTTGRIGTSGFLTRDQIRSLRQHGHIIGSHSVSHPTRMSACGWDELVREWTESRLALADVLGEDVVVASVPGGYFSKRVAKAASVAGIRVLFTSEPTTRCHFVDDCLVVGRYCMLRNTPSTVAAKLARGDLSQRAMSWAWWNTKKLVKSLGGDLYLRARLSLLR